MAIRIPTHGTKEPLIPDIAGMTQRVFAEVDATPGKDLLDRIRSHFKADGRGAPNIESLLSHIRSLKQVAGSDSVRSCKAKELDQLDVDICTSITKLANKQLPDKTTPYHKLAIWIGAIQRGYPVELFTTNYDLLMEQALEEARVPYFDGFVGTYRTFFDLQAMEEDRLPERWARIWKIHGSLNWFEDAQGAIHRYEVAGQRRVIYPSHLKYDESRRMPYLAMIDRLKAFFRQPTPALITTGYSFNDTHLNEVIVNGLQGNPNAIAFGLLFDSLAQYSSAIALAITRPNLNLFAADEAVIGTKRCAWTAGRDANSCPRETTAVEWIDDPVKAGTKKARFKLGDFAQMGSFLEDIIGEKERNIAS